MSPSSVLFVTWDGPQVSYLESLYMPIFQGLAERGHAMHVLQFTWADDARREVIKASCERGGCTYRSVHVMRRPVAAGSLISATLGSAHVRQAIARHDIDVVMPRSTLPAFAARLALRHSPDVGLLFDADGLPHDERVDFGGWSAQGLAYRLSRDMEAAAVRDADIVLTRSSKAIDILAARAGAGTKTGKFRVVANGRDASKFTPLPKTERAALRREIGVESTAPVLVYAGSMGDQYCVPEMLEFFRLVRHFRNDAQLLLLTGSPDEAERRLGAFSDLRPHCHIRRVPSGDVGRYIGACNLGLALRCPSFSMQAVAPLKLGEYLLCGIPVLSTRTIGDTDKLLTNEVGRSLDSMSHAALETAANWFASDVLSDTQGYRARCRDAGVRHYSLDATIDAYADAIDAVRHGK